MRMPEIMLWLWCFWANWFEKYIWCGCEACWQNTSLGRGHPVPISAGGLGGEKWCWNSVYLRRWMLLLWWATQGFDRVQTSRLGLCVLWDQRIPVGIVKGSPVGQSWVEMSLADVWVPVKKSLSLICSILAMKWKWLFLLVGGRRSRSGLGTLAGCQVKTSGLPVVYFTCILYALSTHTVRFSSFWTSTFGDYV